VGAVLLYVRLAGCGAGRARVVAQVGGPWLPWFTALMGVCGCTAACRRRGRGIGRGGDVAMGAASAGVFGRRWVPGVADVYLDEALVAVAGPIGVESGVGGLWLICLAQT